MRSIPQLEFHGFTGNPDSAPGAGAGPETSDFAIFLHGNCRKVPLFPSYSSLRLYLPRPGHSCLWPARSGQTGPSISNPSMNFSTFRNLVMGMLCLAAARPEVSGRELWQDFKAPPHDYWTRPVTDRFSLLKDDLESGRLVLDRSSEKAFLLSLLEALKVPASSQMLVFSATSLQLGLISTRNPRALYFSDDVYVGWMPGGKVEIISLDPALGAIYYIFDVPRRPEVPIRIERSDRCMNCHGAADSGWVPGLVISSVIPGFNSGSLISYRQEVLGHSVPLSERMGGWMVTGTGDWSGHRGNVTGELNAGKLTTTPVEFGTTFRTERYPAATSDLLAHLLHEHQAGFVTTALEAGYRARAALHEGQGKILPQKEPELDQAAEALVRYLLFADEAALPPGGVAGDPKLRQDFAVSRLADPSGRSLRDLELKSRLLQYRCSYMIYSPVFKGLEPVMKQKVLLRLQSALRPGRDERMARHLPEPEKQAIREILQATLPDWPAPAAGTSAENAD